MTKIWRKNEWEEMTEELQKEPKFYYFVQQMYDSNCRERREHGQREFRNVFDYYREYPDWLRQKFYGES